MASPQTPAHGGGLLRALLALLLLAAGVALAVAGRGPLAASGGLTAALWFAAFGFVAVFVLADRSFWAVRALFVALPAFGLGLLAAGVVLWLREREAGPPGPSDLLLPALAVALGIAVGMAWRQGLLPLLLLPLKLASLALVLALAAAVAVVSLAEREALVPAPVVGPGEAVRAADCGRPGPCSALPRAEAETRALRLAPAEIARLVECSLPSLARSDRLRAAASAGDEGRLHLKLSLRVPLVPRWLNAEASARVGVRSGRLALAAPRLRLARFEPRAAVLDWLAPLAALTLQAERPLRRGLAAIREAHLESGQLVVLCAAGAAP